MTSWESLLQPNEASSLRSKRYRPSSSKQLERDQKKKKGMTGEGREGNAWPQTPWFWKTAFAHERSFLIGAVLVVLIK